LNGGIQEAIKNGFPTNDIIEIPKVVDSYKIENWQLPTVNIFEVEQATKDDNYLIVDVRDSARFNGEVEPIDLVAGHIPNATNIPFIANLDKNGLYLSAQELKRKYLEAFNNRKSENIIVHCGSGVTACHTLLALSYAGLEIPKLYVGSWSEWSRNNKPMVTKFNKLK
jgi:thiosulfate/3-mercaptopyruvate sulfurtransferase